MTQTEKQQNAKGDQQQEFFHVVGRQLHGEQPFLVYISGGIKVFCPIIACSPP